MTNITATVLTRPITATISAAGNISANVGSSPVTATASGGIGPRGLDGASGGPIELLTNVRIVGASDGDILQFKNDNYWHNDPIVNGGDF
jgi:hypothetical protein